jgi:hypothetical protein
MPKLIVGDVEVDLTDDDYLTIWTAVGEYQVSYLDDEEHWRDVWHDDDEADVFEESADRIGATLAKLPKPGAPGGTP